MPGIVPSAGGKMGVKQRRQPVWSSLVHHPTFWGPARRQKAPSQDTGSRKTGLHHAYPAASRTRDPYHPGRLPGLALTRRRSCSGPRARVTPDLSFPTRPQDRCRVQLVQGTQTHSVTCKPGPFASLGLSFPSWPHTHPSPQSALEGQTDAKVPEKKWLRLQQ